MAARALITNATAGFEIGYRYANLEKGDEVIAPAITFGSTYKGRKVGTIGHFGSYSFQEVKNITSFGEGGLLTTDIPFGEDFVKARFLWLGFSKKIRNWLYDITALDGRYRPRTPAMAAGLTDQVWTVKEWLTFPAKIL